MKLGTIIGTALAVGVTVAAFETVNFKLNGTYTTWWSSLTSSAQRPATLGAVAAGAVAGYFLSR